ncbi:MAG: TIGR03619 family F420-dependent LLM class oxidoreductase [Nitrososphaeraceae archaeon]|nr:TIGR03619 family F420-dependent LLM class oxidoreductase [Nitrososphaeraceae archaeon]MBV9667268.1 TIGR03619 family F420-dependent LLM class oxidoreductase [Nitrososphaeraceae archaeon]
MKIGITLPQIGQQATKDNIIHVAREAEKEGFDSVWTFDRLLWPLTPQTPYRGTSDGRLPIEMQNVLDPIGLLTFVAANTDKIALGTSVVDVLFHTPVILGRRFATLDVLSEGRVICGLGIGWSEDEYQASNIPFKKRGKRADEFIQVLKKIWTDDVVEFKGEFYNIPSSKIGPKPIQKPHIQIYLGGYDPKAFSRVVNYGANGWLASMSGGKSLQDLENSISELRDRARKANKNPNDFRIILLTYPGRYFNKSDGSSSNNNSSSTRLSFTGTIDEIGTDIQRIKELGIVDHIIFSFNFSAEAENIDKMIDITKQFSKFAK